MNQHKHKLTTVYTCHLTMSEIAKFVVHESKILSEVNC